MFGKYISSVWRFATYRSVSRLDIWQIIAASGVPLYYKVMGWPMPSDTAIWALANLGLLTFGYIAIRFLTAPYFVWREDQEKIAVLTTELNSPKLIERQRIAEHMATVKMSYQKEITRVRRIFIDKSSAKDQMKKAFHGVEVYSDVLWHDVLFRSLHEDFADACQEVFAFRTKHDVVQEPLNFVVAVPFGQKTADMDTKAAALITYVVHGIKPITIPS